jgi:dihydropteroate synthase
MILNIRGNLIEFNRPAVMGIVNVTPDSFFAGSRVPADSVTARVSEMMAQGADIIDLGGYSSRPGADTVTAEEELARLVPAIAAIRERFPDIPVSVDTFRADVARECIAQGADIINDIGGGDLDPEMFGTIADLRVPYILMHMRGTPATMQSLTDYDDVVADVLRDLAFKTDRLHQLGVNDVIIDPGFGFAKTVDQNYRLLAALGMFREIGCPVLAGVSRKTMIWKELGIHPDEALNGTTAINMIALMNGADILRVHDVRECAETVRLFCAYQRNIPEDTHIISVSKSPHNLQ